MEIAEKRQEFISVLPLTEAEGFDPMIPYTQAYHETAGFRRVIGNHNYWGIKKPRFWNGPICIVNTHEFVRRDGGMKKVPVTAEFIDFASAPAAIQWWMQLIKNSRHYKDAWFFRDKYDLFFQHLVDRDEPNELPWATDPTYADKLISLYEILKKRETPLA